MVPIDVADRGAGFVVGRVIGKLVGVPEALPGALGADASGQVELALDDIAPDRVNGRDVGGVSRQGGDIRHSRIHVGGPDGVADRLGLRRDRLVILAVALPVAAGVQEELREVEIVASAGDPVQLHQAHFHDLVPRGIVAPARPEDRAEEIGVLQRDVEESALARRLEVRGRRLEKMPGIVELVAEHRLVHPPLRTRPPVGMPGIDGAGGVKVSVRFLRRGDDGYELVDLCPKLRVVHGRQRGAGPFDDLVDVGVIERILGAEGPLHHMGGLEEIVHASRGVALFEGDGDGDVMVPADARGPELVGEPDGGKRHRLNRVVLRGANAPRDQQACEHSGEMDHGISPGGSSFFGTAIGVGLDGWVADGSARTPRRNRAAGSDANLRPARPGDYPRAATLYSSKPIVG